MRKLRNILMCAALSGMFAGCVDLDIPPKNILSGEDIYNEGGITAYMSGLYSQLPMEDFNMSNDGEYNGFFNWNCIACDMMVKHYAFYEELSKVGIVKEEEYVTREAVIH